MKKKLTNAAMILCVSFTGLYTACKKDLAIKPQAETLQSSALNFSGRFALDSFAVNLTSALDSINATGLSFVIVKNGKVAHSYSYGFERKNPTGGANPFNPKTNICLDSISGTFTQLTMLSTLQKNGLTLDSFIYKYCPKKWNIPAINKTITFRNLLEHTAGLDSFGLSFSDMKHTMERPSSGVGVFDIKFMDYGICRLLLPAIQKVRESAYHGSTNMVDSLIATDFRAVVRQNTFKPGGMSTWRLAEFRNWQPNSSGNELDSLYPFAQYYNDAKPNVQAANGKDFFYSASLNGMYMSAEDMAMVFYKQLNASNFGIEIARKTLLHKIEKETGSYYYGTGIYKAGIHGQTGKSIIMILPDNSVISITSNSDNSAYEYKFYDLIVTSFEAANK